MRATTRLGILATLTAATAIAAACASKGGTEMVCLEVDVSGTVVDFATGSPVPNAQITTVGLLPQLSTTAAADGTFTLPEVPVNGYVILEVTASGYADTLNPALLVEEQDLTGVKVVALATGDAASLETGFGVVETSGLGQIVGHAQFDTGSGIAGISTIQVLPVNFSADGPHFLDDTGAPGPGLAATSSSGGFTFFNVSTGNVAVQASAPNFLFQPVATVSRAGAWSVVTVVGQGGTPGSTPTPTPTGTPATVKYAMQVYPIFTSRGCKTCHRTGNPPGGLRLDQDANKTYDDLKAVSGVINTGNPAASLLLTKPLFEAQPDHGGGNIFLTTSDPDYVTILNWITQGANKN